MPLRVGISGDEDGTASLTFQSASGYITSEDRLFFRFKVKLN